MRRKPQPTDNPFLQLVHEAGLSRDDLSHLTGLGKSTIERLLDRQMRYSVSDNTRVQFAAHFGKRVRVRWEIEE